MGNSKKRSKGYLIAVLVIFILALAAGYAAFTDTLTITGTANANGTFDMEFTSCTATNLKGVDEEETKGVISEDKDTLTVTVKDLAYPGAGAQFDVVVTNVGTIPATIKSVTPTGLEGTTNIKISGLDAITTSHPTIEANGTCSFSFTVEWDVENATDLTDAEKTGIEFGLEIEYEQADAEAYDGTESHTDA